MTQNDLCTLEQEATSGGIAQRPRRRVFRSTLYACDVNHAL